MRPILSATGTYNYNLAKWLEQKLKPLSLNEYTITDAFAFADEIRTHTMNEDDIIAAVTLAILPLGKGLFPTGKQFFMCNRSAQRKISCRKFPWIRQKEQKNCP